MLKLEEIRKHAAVTGIDTNAPVRIVATESVGEDALTVYYKTVDGAVLERMLFRADEPSLSLAEAGRPWAFDASGDEFKLAAEAFRINLAYLFDPMMAVHTSNVEPLPHQITAVYEAMLPKCMVRRPNAREKLRNEESLRQCIRPVCGELSPGHDEIRRVPALQNASAV